MKITETFSHVQLTDPSPVEQVRSNQGSGEIFGLAVTTVFLLMLMLNAISY